MVDSSGWYELWGGGELVVVVMRWCWRDVSEVE